MKLIYKLLFGNVMDEPKECTQNIYVFRYICYCMFFYTIDMVLNELGIFIVDKNIFRRGYLAAVIFLVLYILFLSAYSISHIIESVNNYSLFFCVIFCVIKFRVCSKSVDSKGFYGSNDIAVTYK